VCCGQLTKYKRFSSRIYCLHIVHVLSQEKNDKQFHLHEFTDYFGGFCCHWLYSRTRLSKLEQVSKIIWRKNASPPQTHSSKCIFTVVRHTSHSKVLFLWLIWTLPIQYFVPWSHTNLPPPKPDHDCRAHTRWPNTQARRTRECDICNNRLHQALRAGDVA